MLNQEQTLVVVIHADHDWRMIDGKLWSFGLFSIDGQRRAYLTREDDR